MSPSMTWVPPLLLLCFSAVETVDEPGRERSPDECGDPRRISQSYEVYESTVVEVVNGGTLVVDIHRRVVEFEGVTYTPPRAGETTVQLTCLDAPQVSEPVGRDVHDRRHLRDESLAELHAGIPRRRENGRGRGGSAGGCLAPRHRRDR